MGLEPITTGITILDSTFELQLPLISAGLPPTPTSLLSLRVQDLVRGTSRTETYIVGPLPFLNPTDPPSASILLITSSKSIGAKSVCSTHTQW